MKGIQKLIVLMAAVMGLVGCAGHYIMKGPEDFTTNYDAPIKAYVENYYFNDKPGTFLCANCTRIEGELAPYIKQSLLNAFTRDITFVEKNKANLMVKAKKLEVNTGANGSHIEIFIDVNGNGICSDAYGVQKMQLSGLDEIQAERVLVVSTDLLVKAIKKSLYIENGNIIFRQMPAKISAKVDVTNTLMPIYDEKEDQ